MKAEMGAVVLILTGESEGIGQHTLEFFQSTRFQIGRTRNHKKSRTFMIHQDSYEIQLKFISSSGFFWELSSFLILCAKWLPLEQRASPTAPRSRSKRSAWRCERPPAAHPPGVPNRPPRPQSEPAQICG